MTADEEFVLAALAEACADIAQIAGMTPEEVWDAQFEGRSATVVHTELDDGRTRISVEFADADPDGTVHYGFRRESEAGTSEKDQVT